MVKKLIKREKLDEILKYIDNKEFLAIVGPRQSGKTTLLEIIKEKILDRSDVDSRQVSFMTFQDPLVLMDFENNPVELIKSKINNQKRKQYILIDEFQYANNAGSLLKLIYDTVPNVKIIITGSGSLEIKEISSSMVGRLFSFELLQLDYSEVLKDNSEEIGCQYDQFQQLIKRFFSGKEVKEFKVLENLQRSFETIFVKYVKYGSYPAVYKIVSPDQKMTVLLNIYNTYVEKDLVKLLKVGKTQKFFKLIQYLAINNGQLLNISSIQREIGLKYDEVLSFIDNLEKTYIIEQIRPLYTNKSTELKKNPISYFLDTGLRNWAIRNFNALEFRNDAGHLIENFAFRRLKTLLGQKMLFSNLYFWRRQSGAEVDFVLEKAGDKPEYIPIEVKYQNFDRSLLTKSYISFLETYQPTKGIILTKNYFNVVERKGTKILFLPCMYF